MTIPKFDQLTGSESLPELIEMVAKLQKQVQWLMDGKISSNNVREIGGYNVNDTDLKSVDGDVGLSSANDAVDPVRLWAGSATKETAPWRVAKSGKMVATGALIQSADGIYPLVIFDPDNDLLGAYSSVDKNARLVALEGTTSAPTLIFRDAAVPITGLIYVDSTLQEFTIQSQKTIQISALPSGDIKINGNLVRFQNWSNVYSTGAAQSLQTALNAKATSGSATNTNGAHNHGIPDGATWTTSLGTVTWSSAAAHAHNQT